MALIVSPPLQTWLLPAISTPASRILASVLLALAWQIHKPHCIIADACTFRVRRHTDTSVELARELGRHKRSSGRRKGDKEAMLLLQQVLWVTILWC